MAARRRIPVRPTPTDAEPRRPRELPPVAAGAGPPVRVRDVGGLQRAAGNRAVARLLNGAGSAAVPVQRQPGTRVLPPRTRRWQFDEPYRGRAVMHRTTTIEATAWAEVGPAPPRIRYRREVELKTADGITVYLDIRGTIRLAEGSELPSGPEAALAVSGGAVLSQRTVRVEGGDVIAVNEYAPHEVRGLSFAAVAKAVMPDYAQLPLAVAEQETAILDYLRTLPRRPAAAHGDDGRDTVVVAADIATDFVPIIGELKDLYRAVTGTDPVTGEKLKWWQRALAFIGAIPILGKLFKLVGKGIKFLGKGMKLLGRAGKWLGGRGAAFAGWLAEKFSGWLHSRRARKLAKAEAEVKRLAAAESEVARLAEARRLARTAAPSLSEVQKLVPAGTDWMHWGMDIFGQGPADALARIGARTPQQLLAIGVSRDVAQALYNWYRALGSSVGAQTRVNRLQLLEHIIGLF